MKIIKIILLSGLVISTLACSTESLKRISYETLQNISVRKCEQNLSSKCPKREGYDDYQRRRKEVNGS